MVIDTNIKRTIHDRCADYVDQRVAMAQEAITSLKESATNETKSSAGDKHETGRAMIHLELEKSSRQLSEALQLKQVMDRLDVMKSSDRVMLGSLVVTDRGSFYFSIGVGKISLENQDFFAVSITSPVAQKFRGSQKGDEITFNGSVYKILDLL